jgi:hypothetical protein
MNGAPFTHRTPEKAAASEESLAGRDALVALVRILARQAAREALIASRVEQETQNDEEED